MQNGQLGYFGVVLYKPGGLSKGWSYKAGTTVDETCNNKGNSVARDLPRTGSETNTTIFVIYIYIGYRFPMSLSTIWGNHLPANIVFKFPTCISTIWRNHLPHLTSKWRGTFQYFQFHDKMPYIYYLEKPPPI